MTSAVLASGEQRSGSAMHVPESIGVFFGGEGGFNSTMLRVRETL